MRDRCVQGDPVAKTSVSSSMDYVAVREDATTKAEAAVNVGLARLADVKYLRRNFRRGMMRSLMRSFG